MQTIASTVCIAAALLLTFSGRTAADTYGKCEDGDDYEELLDGGNSGYCRLPNKGTPNNNLMERHNDVGSESKCREKCTDHADCTAFEYVPAANYYSNDACEVWRDAIASATKGNGKCFLKCGDATTTAATTTEDSSNSGDDEGSDWCQKGTNTDAQFLCFDGSTCTGVKKNKYVSESSQWNSNDWVQVHYYESCCGDNEGVKKCPKDLPGMAKNKEFAGGWWWDSNKADCKDHCCVETSSLDHSVLGGARTCPATTTTSTTSTKTSTTRTSTTHTTTTTSTTTTTATTATETTTTTTTTTTTLTTTTLYTTSLGEITTTHTTITTTKTSTTKTQTTKTVTTKTSKTSTTTTTATSTTSTTTTATTTKTTATTVTSTTTLPITVTYTRGRKLTGAPPTDDMSIVVVKASSNGTANGDLNDATVPLSTTIDVTAAALTTPAPSNAKDVSTTKDNSEAALAVVAVLICLAIGAAAGLLVHKRSQAAHTNSPAMNAARNGFGFSSASPKRLSAPHATLQGTLPVTNGVYLEPARMQGSDASNHQHESAAYLQPVAQNPTYGFSRGATADATVRANPEYGWTGNGGAGSTGAVADDANAQYGWNGANAEQTYLEPVPTNALYADVVDVNAASPASGTYAVPVIISGADSSSNYEYATTQEFTGSLNEIPDSTYVMPNGVGYLDVGQENEV